MTDIKPTMIEPAIDDLPCTRRVAASPFSQAANEDPMRQSPLFEPFRLKSLSLPNRVVMAPMTMEASPGGVPDDHTVQHYACRAAGGTALLITEGTTIGRPAASHNGNIPNFHAADALSGWAKVVEAVHAAGGKIAPQLWHEGMARKPGTGPNSEAPSEGPSVGSDGGIAMSDTEIADTLEAFAIAAGEAKRLGFDAVEIHGGHGYLLDNFFWESQNKRTDGYGGNHRNRGRFAGEVVQAIRAAVGEDFPIIMRFSQFKLEDYLAKIATSPQELEDLLAPCVEAGVDMFHASQRRFFEPEFEGSNLNLAGWTKKLTGLPTITVGSVGLKGADALDSLRGGETGPDRIDRIEERLANGEFDLVAVGRALLTDPTWTEKVREGRFSEMLAFDPASLGRRRNNVDDYLKDSKAS